jgi:hypothetical protein
MSVQNRVRRRSKSEVRRAKVVVPAADPYDALAPPPSDFREIEFVLMQQLVAEMQGGSRDNKLIAMARRNDVSDTFSVHFVDIVVAVTTSSQETPFRPAAAVLLRLQFREGSAALSTSLHLQLRSGYHDDDDGRGVAAWHTRKYQRDRPRGRGVWVQLPQHQGSTNIEVRA